MPDFLSKFNPETNIFAPFEVKEDLPVEERAFQTWRALLAAKRSHDGLFLVIGKLLKDVIKYIKCLKVSIQEQSQIGEKEKNFQSYQGKIAPSGIRTARDVLTVERLFQKLSIQLKDVENVLINIKKEKCLRSGKVENQIVLFAIKNFPITMSKYVGTVVKKLELNLVLKPFHKEYAQAQSIKNGVKKFWIKIATSVEFVVQLATSKLTTLFLSFFSLNTTKNPYFLRLEMAEFYVTPAMLKKPTMEQKIYE